MIEFEEITNENGNIVIIDEDGLITIQMEEDVTLKIFDAFDKYIKNNKEKTLSFGYHNDLLELSLRIYGDTFSITGELWDDIKNDSSYFHGFEIEDCDIQTWDYMYEFLKQ